MRGRFLRAAAQFVGNVLHQAFERRKRHQQGSRHPGRRHAMTPRGCFDIR